MASENETMAEVLAEFGKNIELMRSARCVGVSLWNCMKFKLRIELAHKREVDELQTRLDEIVKYAGNNNWSSWFTKNEFINTCLKVHNYDMNKIKCIAKGCE